MAETRGGSRPAGFVVGSMVAVTFGTVFVMVNSGGVPDPWPLVIRVAGLLGAALLVIALVRTVRITSASAPGQVDRRFWLVVAAEAGALFGGLALINGVLHRSAVSVAWVALVVGLHFFALAAIWRMPLYHSLGAAMTLLGLGGFLIYALGGSAGTVGIVSGVGSGWALYGAVAAALRGGLDTGRPGSPAGR